MDSLFFGSLVVEEISLALWNGYGLTATVFVTQVIVFPAVFAVALYAAYTLLPLVVKREFRSRRMLFVSMGLAAFLIGVLAVPLSRTLVTLFFLGFIYANWWHPVESTQGLFWALLPFPAACVFLALWLQYSKKHKLGVGSLSFAGALALILLSISGIDNSLCLGDWYGDLNQSSRLEGVYLVHLRLNGNHQGNFGTSDRSFPNRGEPSLDKAYKELYSGDIIWAQRGRTITIYSNPSSLPIAVGTASASADTISLRTLSPPLLIDMSRDHRH